MAYQLDIEKAETALKILGIEKVKEMKNEFKGEPVFFNAVFHWWQIKTIDEMLRMNLPVKDIVSVTGVSRQTVYNKKILYLGIKPKNPENDKM
ncbi:MAG TPA: hypothetical protein VI757_06620 [Bacteroidia bacterium]|nr:hypothetical protein [Bacteroidia bacterium]